MANQAGTAKSTFARQWQLPTVAIGFLLVGYGLISSSSDHYPVDEAQANLGQIRESIALGKYSHAWESLGWLEAKPLSDQAGLHGQIALLRAHARFNGQRLKVKRAGDWDQPLDDAAVIESYELAEELLGDLESQYVLELAQAMVRVGRGDEALLLMGRMGDQEARHRQLLLRLMVTQAMAVRPVDARAQESAEALIKKFDQTLSEARKKYLRVASDAPGAKKALSDEHRSHEIWLAGRQAERLLRPVDGRSVDQAKKDSEQAERVLSRAIGFNEGTGVPLGELRVLLAEAYRRNFMAQQKPSAESRLSVMDVLDRAEKAIQADGIDPERRDRYYGQYGHGGEVLLGRALVLLVAGAEADRQENMVEAKGLLDRAIGAFPGRSSEGRARVARVEVMVRLGQMTEAVKGMRQIVHLYHGEGALGGDPTVKELLRDRAAGIYSVLSGADRNDLAIRFLAQERRLFVEGSTGKAQMHRLPIDLLQRLALSHQRLAEKLDPPNSRAAPQSVARLSAREHRHLAGDYFHEHSRLASFGNEALSGESLWQAASMYALAADVDALAALGDASLEAKVAADRTSAIEAYTEHFRNRPNDPKRAESMHRLGMLYLQTGDHHADRAGRWANLAGRGDPAQSSGNLNKSKKARSLAVMNYRNAIETFGQLSEQKPRSPFASASQVPWALAYLKMGPRFIDQAEERLQAVIQDHQTLSLGSDEYRRALVALGDLYVGRGREGDFRRAVDQYQMVLDQDLKEAKESGKTPRSEVGLLFKVGDARRKAVLQLDDFLGKHALPPKRRAILEEIRTQHFQEARRLFDSVITAYDQQSRAMTAQQEQEYRSSYFYRADSAYELKKYEGKGEAIDLYKSAVVKFGNHPMSLIAEIQLYNIHTELGQAKEAMVAVNRAKARLKAVRDRDFESSPSVMSRQYWQRWLEWSADHLDGSNTLSNVAGADTP